MNLYETMNQRKFAKKGELRIKALITIPEAKIRLLEQGEEVNIYIRGIAFTIKRAV